MSVAQAGFVSEVIDLPHLVLDAAGQTSNGCWNARTWPIFDDDSHLLGFVDGQSHIQLPRSGAPRVLELRERGREEAMCRKRPIARCFYHGDLVATILVPELCSFIEYMRGHSQPNRAL